MFRVWPTRKRAIKTSGHFPHPLQLVTYGIGWVLSPHFTLKLISSLVPLNRGWAIYQEQIIESRYIKFSPKLSILEIWIWKLSTNYRYRKMHQIWSDKYMKSQTIRNLVSSNFYPKNARQITPSCLFTMKSSTDTILILCPVDVLWYFFTLFWAILS